MKNWAVYNSAKRCKGRGILPEDSPTPYLGGTLVTHADLAWFPTAVFMEYLLPKVFGWTPIFSVVESGCTNQVEICREFPLLGKWYRTMENQQHFARTRQEIRSTLMEQASRGRFVEVKKDVDNHRDEYKWKYV